MGCEDFVVRLSSSYTPQAVISALLAVPQVHPDTAFPSLPGESHLCWEDRDHIIEIEVAGTPQATVSLRFAVCHPRSIDDVFADFVIDLVTRLRADVVIAEDVQPDDPGLGWSFPPSEVSDLRRALVQCIPKKRRLWQIEFGNVEARVSCRDAISRFVIRSTPQGP